MSKIKVNEIEAQSGSTITIPTGQSLVVTDGMAASTITSGTLSDARLPTIPVSKGGTGLTSLGSANQVLRTNSGGTALEFADVSGGIVKITTYENNTRIVLSSLTNGTIFNDITISKVKDATTSKIIAIGLIPGELYNSYHSGLYFVCTTTGMDNSGTNDSSAFRGIGQSYGYDTNAPGMIHVNKTFQDATNLGTGSHTFKIGWRSKDGALERPADIINANTTDDGRAHQTGTSIQLMEVLI